jgi:hypothetical protein
MKKMRNGERKMLLSFPSIETLKARFGKVFDWLIPIRNLAIVIRNE